MAKFYPLFSSSTGNSYYIESNNQGILVDAGRSSKQILLKLNEYGVDLSCLKGIFITHEHSDHVKGLKTFASKMKVPVFASCGTIKALSEKNILTDKFETYAVKKSEIISCAGMSVKPFSISHDCAEGFGYRVSTNDGKTAVFCTDLGIFTDTVLGNIIGSDIVILESNHDVGMLENGYYPFPLKKRILSDKGHLSNISCAEAASKILNYGAAHFFLAHLSQENNTPDLALQTTRCTLTMDGYKEGKDFTIDVLSAECCANPTFF